MFKGILIGQCTRKKEITNTNGYDTFTFSLEYSEKAGFNSFVSCTVFGQKAREYEKLVVEGNFYLVDGKPRASVWQEKPFLSLTVNTVELVFGSYPDAPKEPEKPSPYAQKPKTIQEVKENAINNIPADMNDLPF